jgi:hypothetical protein
LFWFRQLDELREGEFSSRVTRGVPIASTGGFWFTGVASVTLAQGSLQYWLTRSSLTTILQVTSPSTRLSAFRLAGLSVNFVSSCENCDCRQN